MKSLLSFSIVQFFFLSVCFSQQSHSKLIVCGDSIVTIIELSDEPAKPYNVIWKWSSYTAAIPDDFYQFIHSTDECKPINNGEKILITASWRGGAVIVDVESKEVEFYARLENAHSAELLPGDRLVVAGSTAKNGNKLNVYSIHQSDSVLFTDSLYSGHGVIWDEKRQILYALGYNVLREYSLENWDAETPSLNLIRSYKIPGISGHDLQRYTDESKLIITENQSTWLFDKITGEFSEYEPLAGIERIKSVDFHPQTKQLVYVKADKNASSITINFHNPDFTISIDKRVYKVRWLH